MGYKETKSSRAYEAKITQVIHEKERDIVILSYCIIVDLFRYSSMRILMGIIDQ